MKKLKRIIRHLSISHITLRRCFPAQIMKCITAKIAEVEKQHSGEIVFTVEARLSLRDLLHGKTSREKALEAFSKLRVWDTENNSGVLLYVLLADRRVEIVADRGIHKHVKDEGWQTICRCLEEAFRARKFEEGVFEAIEAISKHLIQHFPCSAEDRNEIPDEPVVLP